MSRLRCCLIALVAALAFAGASTALAPPVEAQQTQVVVACPVPVSSVNNGVAVCVDRGTGALYLEGESITICASVNIPTILIFPPPPDPTVRVTSAVAGSPQRTLFEFTTRSGSRCTTATVAPPLGQETIRADVIDTSGRLIAGDSVSFRSAPRGGGSAAVTVTVDRGAGGFYRVGENIQVCVVIGSGVSTTRYSVRLINIVNGVQLRTYDLGEFAGSRCTTLAIEAPTGQETMRAEVRERFSNVLVATGSVSYVTTGGIVPPPPGPPPPFPPPTPGGPSGPPARFSGTVTLNGAPAPFGTTVQAYVNGLPCGSGAVSGVGTYVVDVGSGTAAAGCAADGAAVSFVVGTAQAYETGVFQTGTFFTLNLNAVTGGFPPPPPPGPGPGPYGAPSGLRAIALDASRAQLSWFDPSGEIGFRIYDGYTLVGSPGPNATSFTVTGLPANTYFCFQVTAVYPGGFESAPSEWGCVVTLPAGPPPAPPYGLTAVPWSSTIVRLDWFDNSGDEHGFRVFNGGTEIAVVAANTTTFFVTGLPPGSYNCFRVLAFNDYGDSASTDWGCATTPFFGATPDEGVGS